MQYLILIMLRLRSRFLPALYGACIAFLSSVAEYIYLYKNSNNVTSQDRVISNGATNLKIISEKDERVVRVIISFSDYYANPSFAAMRQGR